MGARQERARRARRSTSTDCRDARSAAAVASNFIRPNDDHGRALAKLLAKWCDEQDNDAAIKRWAEFHGEDDQGKSLRRAFEAAFGTEVDDRASMADRAGQARELAANEAFDDAIDGALAHAQRDWALAIRDSGGLKSFKQAFFKEPTDGGGWFNFFLVAIGREFKADQEFKRLWDSVQIGAISAMMLDDIELSAERRRQLTQLIEGQSGHLADMVAAVKGDTDALLGGQREAEAAAERRHREQLEATTALRLEIAREKGVEAAKLVPLFEHLGQIGLTIDEMRVRAGEAIAEIISRSERQVEQSNEGADIDAAIGAARQKLAGLDTAGARAVLTDKIAEEEEARRQRLVPLLQEKVAIERLGYDYKSAKATLRRLVALAPNSVWDWIDLGDLFVTIGSIEEAATAFGSAMDAARRTGRERDLSVSYDRVGDVLVAQGNLPEALKSFRDGLAIADRLAKADPGNAGWQRDLSVSYNKIGDVLVAQGNLPEALKSFRDGLAIGDRLAKADPGNAGWQRDLSVSYNKIGDVLVAQGNLPEALKSFRDGARHQRPSGEGRPRQRRLAARSLGVVQQDRRRAGGAGQSAGGAEIVPRQPRHHRPSGEGRPRQRRLAARSVGVVQQDRRRAGGAGQPARGAEILPRQRSPLRPSGEGRPRQRRLAARSVGVVQQDRRRAGGAGQSAGGAEIVPRRARHQRPSGEGRPRQRRLAARSVGVVQQGRRRAGGAGQSAGGAEIVPRRARDQQTVWRRPTPATPAGSAICRCRTTRSATCWWRRAICRRR